MATFSTIYLIHCFRNFKSNNLVSHPHHILTTTCLTVLGLLPLGRLLRLRQTVKFIELYACTNTLNCLLNFCHILSYTTMAVNTHLSVSVNPLFRYHLGTAVNSYAPRYKHCDLKQLLCY